MRRTTRAFSAPSAFSTSLLIHYPAAVVVTLLIVAVTIYNRPRSLRGFEKTEGANCEHPRPFKMQQPIIYCPGWELDSFRGLAGHIILLYLVRFSFLVFVFLGMVSFPQQLYYLFPVK